MTIAKVYGLALQSMLNKEIDYDTDTIKAMLAPPGFVPDQDTHRYKSSVTEISTVATSLSAATAAGDTAITTGASIPVNTRIAVDTGAALEVRNVTAVSGAGPFTLTLDVALASAHASAVAVQASPGYAAGGATLTTKTVTYDAATNKVGLNADDPTWPTSSILARFVIFYDDTPATDATKPLIAYADFESNVSTTNGAFAYQLDAAGFATFTAT